MKKRRSLESFFRRQTRRWSLLGFGMTLVFAIPCLFYAEKTASERQLITVARAGATAFRPLILEGNIRDAQIQIREALGLKPDESAVVRDANLKLIYSIDPSIAREPSCRAPDIFCWSPRFSLVTTLYPIYFDEPERKNLFGYLEVTLRPALDYSILWYMAILILAAFVGQAIGMTTALSGAAKNLGGLFNQWAEHLRKSPTSSLPEGTETPFTEMATLEQAVDGLHFEIERLQADAATEAKASAHFSLLREIGHDLRTPHSQLAKNFALLVDTVKTTNALDETEVIKVERNLKRMGDLIRQVRTLSVGQKPFDNLKLARLSLQSEMETLIEDLKTDPEILENKILVEYRKDENVPPAQITKLEFYRIFENLVRNAIVASVGRAFPKIIIRLNLSEGRPTLSIIDNGVGIPQEIQPQIFNFNFTTKPARGTGLGLGIVKHLCEQYGAFLNFRSEVGKGTEFHIAFALAQTEVVQNFDFSQEATYGQI